MNQDPFPGKSYPPPPPDDPCHRHTGIKLVIIAPDTQHNRDIYHAILQHLRDQGLEKIETCPWGPYSKVEVVTQVAAVGFNQEQRTKNQEPPNSLKSPT